MAPVLVKCRAGAKSPMVVPSAQRLAAPAPAPMVNRRSVDWLVMPIQRRPPLPVLVSMTRFEAALEAAPMPLGWPPSAR